MVTLLTPAIVALYQGLRESWKFQYYTPRLTKKVKGNSGWMEVRFRHPSPANDPVNEHSAAREHLRHHFKLAYPYSRYYVRNFWDPVKEDGKYSIISLHPNTAEMTPEQQSLFFNYIKGDDLGNKAKKEKYEAHAAQQLAKNNPKEWSEETKTRMQGDLRIIFKGLSDSVKERHDLDNWQDPCDFPGDSPYYQGPDTFMHEYDLVHISSYEMQLYIELEHALIEFRDQIEADGVDTVEGNSANWTLLDNSHSPAQQQEVVKSLKQRNVKTIS